MRDGEAHGVFLANSDGMDIKIAKTDQGDQYLEYNINGGVLDLFFLGGPTPSEVSKQYAGIVGTVSVWFDLRELILIHSSRQNKPTGRTGSINASMATKML